MNEDTNRTIRAALFLAFLFGLVLVFTEKCSAGDLSAKNGNALRVTPTEGETIADYNQGELVDLTKDGQAVTATFNGYELTAAGLRKAYILWAPGQGNGFDAHEWRHQSMTFLACFPPCVEPEPETAPWDSLVIAPADQLITVGLLAKLIEGARDSTDAVITDGVQYRTLPYEGHPSGALVAQVWYVEDENGIHVVRINNAIDIPDGSGLWQRIWLDVDFFPIRVVGP